MEQVRTYTPCPVPYALPRAVASLRTRWGSTFPKPLVRQQKQNIRFASVPFLLACYPLTERRPKCRKVYDLDSQGNRIPDGKGGWKNHREDTTDWNNRENAEKWRAAWAAYANRALEVAGRPERIDHRSYKRQGIDKIPSIHMGPAASQMERRGIATEKGDSWWKRN